MTITLDAAQNNALAAALAACENNDPVTETEAYVLEAQLMADHMPRHVRAALLGLRARGSAAGGLLIRNVPLGEVPRTPERADLGVGIQLKAAKALSVLTAPLGDQFGFLSELGGQIVQDILPVAGYEHAQQSISSSSLLEMHSETAFTDTRADFVGLLCLRADSEDRAATLLSPALDVLARLDPGTRNVLRQPRFATAVDESFLRGSGIPGPIRVQPITVLSGSEDAPRLRCDFAETIGADKGSQRALDLLHEAASAVARYVCLEPGDLLIVDNHGALHGRTPFSRRGDGRDRWLLRTFVARDLARSAKDRPGNGRIVQIDYSGFVSAGSELDLADDFAG
ncbi:TauD/TfdA family dioxygenase [Amycolatopsis sp. Hca4]|uniref:TauD/TfdA family dioxygenase n=1 Tax=Amycolatopsis sp. Hca4 TaxID=2742131 RepID=UPI001590DC9A|nr:TauD/TfdA family dioxygenase [Amycolatopsis sp. Hca4]QKV73985.1 TauD/TfdA family dioxygenase [Amycolatopsis sp. Hca4]